MKVDISNNYTKDLIIQRTGSNASSDPSFIGPVLLTSGAALTVICGLDLVRRGYLRATRPGSDASVRLPIVPRRFPVPDPTGGGGPCGSVIGLIAGLMLMILFSENEG